MFVGSLEQRYLMYITVHCKQIECKTLKQKNTFSLTFTWAIRKRKILIDSVKDS